MLLGLEENMLFIRRKHPIHSTLVLLPAFALNRRSLFTHGGDGVEPQTISASCSNRPLAHVLKCDVTQVGGIDPLWLRGTLERHLWGAGCSSSSWNTTTKILMVGAEQNGGKQARASSKLTWSPLVLRFSLSLSVFAQLCVSDNSSAGQLFSSPQTFTRRQSSKTT